VCVCVCVWRNRRLTEIFSCCILKSSGRKLVVSLIDNLHLLIVRICNMLRKRFVSFIDNLRPLLWSSGQSFWLLTQRSCVRFKSHRFSTLHWVWNGVHSTLVRIDEEILERKIAVPV
jgi:hypothetical protein